ncbi:MAG: low temperature requirement protein A [Acidobacteria bacterium]|nr:low temperature requirement protein A [Acidobacteriota bacterium]
MSRAIPEPSSRFGRPAPVDEGHSASRLELFFDLVYVFGFTQVTALMVQSHDASAVLQALVVLGLLWWTWANASWFANEVSTDRGLPQVGMIVTMGVVLIEALVIPLAYASSTSPMPALTIALGFLIVGIVFTTNWLVITGRDPRLRRLVLRSFLTATAPSAALLIVGALVGPPWQTFVWLGAFLLDAGIIYVNLRASPRLNSAEHFAERHELVLLLALGESIVSIGVSASTLTLDLALFGEVLCALSLAVALWFAYFTGLSASALRALKAQAGGERGASAIDAYTYLHLVLVTGVILTAVGIHVAIDRTGAPELGYFGAATLNGGVAVYLLGTMSFLRRMRGPWLIVRIGGAALTAVLIPVAAAVAPGLGVLMVAALTVIVLATEHVRARSDSPPAGPHEP